MGTSKALRSSTKAAPSLPDRLLHLESGSGDGFRLPASLFSGLTEKNMAPIIGHGLTGAYSVSAATGWSLTTAGTGDNIANAVTGGIQITAASDDNFDTTLDSLMTVTPTTDKWYSMNARIKVSAVTGIGFYLGLTTGAGAAALPFGTEYTDVIALRKAITSADVYGRARGNGGTAVSTDAALGTMVNATEVEVGMCFYLHATTPSGYFSYKTATADAPTITPFTSAQLAQLAAILTTPPTMYWTLHVTGVTGTNPTADIVTFIAGGDR